MKIKEYGRISAFLNLEFFMLILVIGIGVAVAAQSIQFAGVWAIRDTERALGLFRHFDIQGFAGPELTHGGRLPGPMQHILYGIALTISPTLEGLYGFCLFLFGLSLLFIYQTLKIVTQSWKTSLTLLVFIVLNGFILEIPFTVFNPSFLLFFHSLIIWLICRLFFGGKHRLAPLIIFLWGCSLQVHFSSFLILPLILFSFFRSLKFSPKVLLTLMIALVLPFIPYGIYEWMVNAPKIKADQYPFPHYLFLSLSLPTLLFWTFIYPLLQRNKEKGNSRWPFFIQCLAIQGAFFLLFSLFPNELNRYFWGQPLGDLLRRAIIFLSTLLEGDFIQHGMWRYVERGDPYRSFYDDLSHSFFSLAFRGGIKLLIGGVFLGWLTMIVHCLFSKRQIKRETYRKLEFLFMLYFLPTFTGIVIARLLLESEGFTPIHHKFYLLIPYLLFFGLSFDLGIKWLRKKYLRSYFLLGGLPLFFLSAFIIQWQKLTYFKEHDPVEYKAQFRKLVYVRFPIENQLTMFKDQIGLSSEDFTSRLFYYSGLQEGGSDVHYDYLREGRFRNYSRLSPQVAALYQEDQPCYYVEAKKKWLDNSHLIMRKRMKIHAEVISKKETENFYFWTYKPRFTDFCFTNSRVGYVLTEAQRLASNSREIKWGEETPTLIRGKRKDSVFFHLWPQSLNIPLIFEIFPYENGSFGVLIDSRFMENYGIVSISGYDTKIRHKQLRFQNIDFTFQTKKGHSSRVQLVRHDKAGENFFGGTYWENKFWLTYFPVQVKGPPEIRNIEDIKGLKIAIQYGDQYASVFSKNNHREYGKEVFILKNFFRYVKKLRKKKGSVKVLKTDFSSVYPDAQEKSAIH